MDSLLVLMGIHILNMFKDSAESLLSFVRRRSRTVKVWGTSLCTVLANIRWLVSWLSLGNTAIDCALLHYQLILLWVGNQLSSTINSPRMIVSITSLCMGWLKMKQTIVWTSHSAGSNQLLKPKRMHLVTSSFRVPSKQQVNKHFSLARRHGPHLRPSPHKVHQEPLNCIIVTCHSMRWIIANSSHHCAVPPCYCVLVNIVLCCWVIVFLY